MFSTGHTEGGKVNRVCLPRWPFRPSPARVLAKAQADYQRAKARWDDAYARQHTQDMHDATAPLQRAHAAWLAAEVAVNPLPPMPRRSGPTSQGI
jgi:hypothetical protein